MGYTLIASQVPARESFVDQFEFFQNVLKDPCGDCWIWYGPKNANNYGYISVKNEIGKKIAVLAHRASMFFAHGAIPDGMVVDHKCHVDAIEAGTCKGGDSCLHRLCVNPDHLRFLTPEENRKYRTFPATMKKRCVDNCLSGKHDWIPENITTYPEVQASGNTIIVNRCRLCVNDLSRAKSRDRYVAQRPDARFKDYWSNSHCPHGHERTEANTVYQSGKPRCRLCWNELQRKRNAAKREAEQSCQ